MMKSAFLKIRTTPERLEKLKARAGKSGMRVSTFANDILEREDEDTSQATELAELKSQVQALVALIQSLRQNSPMADAETQMALRELRLLVRELAMHTNAQILARVASQLKTNF